MSAVSERRERELKYYRDVMKAANAELWHWEQALDHVEDLHEAAKSARDKTFDLRAKGAVALRLSGDVERLEWYVEQKELRRQDALHVYMHARRDYRAAKGEKR